MEIVEKPVKSKNSAVKKDTKTKSAAATSTPTVALEKSKTTNTAETNVETAATTTTTTTTAATRIVEVLDAANSKSTAAITATATAATKTPIARSNMDRTNMLNDSAMIIETISISDGEDSPTPQPTPTEVAATKKRKSVSAKAEEEEHLRFVKHRKIKVAGAPKMPLTGYVRYMNDRREILKKEQPTKTAMELTKIIAEEWSQLTEERKAPYIKSAEVDKQRYLSELQVFLKARPDVLACELAKNKPRKSAGSEQVSAAAKAASKDKQQTNDKDLPAAKQLSKDDLTISAANSKARAIMHTRRLSVNYTMPTYEVKDDSPPAATNTEKIKPKSAAAAAPPTDSTPLSVLTQAKRKRTPTPTSNFNNNINNSNNSNNNSNNNNNNNNNSNNSNNSANNNNINLAAALSAPIPGEIPIFTNEFLEHNKTFDMELRTLRKSKADLEQQNAVLEKHVENMKFGVEKMANENDELQEKNRLLELYLDKLKRKLANALSGLSIPSEPQGATVENIDKYMSDLYKMSTSNTHGPASLNKAKDIIRKLDLQIQL